MYRFVLEISSVVKQWSIARFMLLFFLLNMAVKGWFIGQNSLAGDEPFSVYHAQMDVESIIRLLSSGNNPPLFEVLLHFWINVFGISEISVRMPSLLFSSVTVVYLFLMAATYLDRKSAIAVALIFIFSNYHIGLTHEARVYSLLGMLTVISINTYLTIVTSAINGKSLDGYGHFFALGIINSLAIYAHYFGFIIIIIQGCFALINFRVLKQYHRGILVTIATLLVAYAPNVSVVFQRFSESSSGTWIPAPTGLDSLYFMFVSMCNAPVTAVFIIMLIMASGCWRIRLKSRAELTQKSMFNIFISSWFVVVFFGMFLVSFKTPVFFDRYLMVATVVFPLIIGIAISSGSFNSRLQPWITLVTALLFVVTANPALSNNRPIKAVVEQIKIKKTEHTVVFICPDWLDLNLIYYYDRACFKNFDTQDIKRKIRETLINDNVFPITNHRELSIGLRDTTNHILFLDDASNVHYPNNKLEEKLKDHGEIVGVHNFNKGLRLLELRNNKN